MVPARDPIPYGTYYVLTVKYAYLTIAAMDKLREKARQIQTEAQQKLERLQTEGERLRQSSLESLEAAKEAAKQKAATMSMTNLTSTTCASAMSSLGILPTTMSRRDSSDPTCEQSQSEVWCAE